MYYAFGMEGNFIEAPQVIYLVNNLEGMKLLI
jgi:hypothetical protein